jgi:hypothetical protein
LELGPWAGSEVGWAEGGDGLATHLRTVRAGLAQGGLGHSALGEDQVVTDEQLPMVALGE